VAKTVTGPGTVKPVDWAYAEAESERQYRRTRNEQASSTEHALRSCRECAHVERIECGHPIGESVLRRVPIPAHMRDRAEVE
jgi:hypothetical protein